jgi:hypothetical protein
VLLKYHHLFASQHNTTDNSKFEITINYGEGKQPIHGQMAQGSLGQEIECFSKEKTNAGFGSFQGSFNGES